MAEEYLVIKVHTDREIEIRKIYEIVYKSTEFRYPFWQVCSVSSSVELSEIAFPDFDVFGSICSSPWQDGGRADDITIFAPSLFTLLTIPSAGISTPWRNQNLSAQSNPMTKQHPINNKNEAYLCNYLNKIS